MFAPSTLDSSSSITGAIRTSGGLSTAKNLYVGSNINIATTASASVGSIRQNGVNLIHTYGTNNQFIGEGAGNFTLTANTVTAIGREAAAAITSGGGSVYIGYNTGKLITTGANNVAVGAYAMAGTGTGAADNMAFGTEALRYTTGNQSVAMGVYALNNATQGTNTAVGWAALNTITTGINNVAIGNSAGRSLAAASAAAQNTFIGSQAGYDVVNQLTNATNSIAIGYLTYTTASNQAVIGNSSITTTILRGDLQIGKTITAGGTTGAQTISKASGSVNFAAAATSLVVTSTICTTSSVILCTIATNDATAADVKAVAASGSFTIYLGIAPTAETRVNFLITN